MPKYKTEDLPELVKEIDRAGGDAHHPSLSHLHPFKLEYESVIDESLCPFSPEYYAQQIELYEEISNRKLNQETNELHPQYNIPAHIDAPNPLGIVDINNSGGQVRGLATMISVCGLCGLSNSPKILDLGAGHGLASELFAYLGCKVHSVDIDPDLGKLARMRADYKKLNVHRHTQNFEDLSNLESDFDAAFFYQSLHHCLKPWEIIAEVKQKLNPQRPIIAFTGEPVYTSWKHWGLRLELDAIYVARKFGWFESGWSREFLEKCFLKSGMKLKLFTGGYAQSKIGVAMEEWDTRFTDEWDKLLTNYCKQINVQLVPPKNHFSQSLQKMGYRFARYYLYEYLPRPLKQALRKLYRRFLKY